MQKSIPIMVFALLIVGGGSFYAGIKYDQNKAVASPSGFRNGGGGGRMGGGMRGANGGFISGDILAQDATSVTVKLRDGGSKIVFFSDTTQVMKAVAGTAKDLAVGEQVSVQGTPNSDGSVTAQSIQIRPSLPASK